ncbi:hypothetical protein F6X40_24235 [Paraburkholderia sp. UCT31]|uniref:hypothetical protein n=1 Tax=Paraburkholderia sp. UCT31 TaxID=2615209 RepID=UPI001655FAE6|nr:hypothetical protein [Paraburkholderia sp. UCT31]MBC8739826.1 hypothetical protein [Paraburkholderia sp. UCT31]
MRVSERDLTNLQAMASVAAQWREYLRTECCITASLSDQDGCSVCLNYQEQHSGAIYEPFTWAELHFEKAPDAQLWLARFVAWHGANRKALDMKRAPLGDHASYEERLVAELEALRENAAQFRERCEPGFEAMGRIEPKVLLFADSSATEGKTVQYESRAPAEMAY